MTLVLPPRLTDSARAMRDTAQARGLATVQLTTFAVPADLRAGHLHAGPAFADVAAPALGIGLLQAPEDWLAQLPRTWTGREIVSMPIREAYALRRPAFIKSPNDKQIRAMVYTDGSRLPGPDQVDATTTVLVSDMVEFSAEYRLYLLDGTVHTGSRYAENGRLSLGPLSEDATAFATDLLAECGETLPTAIVVDVGRTEGQWAVIEANAAWASGMYTSDPQRALDVLLRAAAPDHTIAPRDRAFLRSPSPTPISATQDVLSADNTEGRTQTGNVLSADNKHGFIR
ncbi:ATP-grasp domain-containing protein [Streptomyces sp. NPDC051561]|uniref:ATP-grasp domain-containing protein n=1 Tax=Streptomyces sp. NPDC051561 TaxID=3365658 RepID=UPI0037B0109C